MRYFTCPAPKTGKDLYKIVCNKCKAVQGYCYASDNTLYDWVDFHYVQICNGEKWEGCFTPHVSPITEILCFECTCGNDTRDFRANVSLPGTMAIKKERENRVGRHLGQRGEKFTAIKVQSNKILSKKLWLK